jgi:hypothetical protein
VGSKFLFLKEVVCGKRFEENGNGGKSFELKQILDGGRGLSN